MTRSPLLCPLLVVLLAAASGKWASGAEFESPACRVVPLPGHRTAFVHGGKRVAVWHYGPDYPRPFFYPFLSPRGTSLTRMGHPGAPNHDHHRSIWFAHHKVAGVDFWGDGGEGRIRQKQWLVYQDGDEEAVMAVLLGWFDAAGRELMEQEVVAAWRPGEEAGHELELQLTFRPTDDVLELEKTNFGFLAVRMAKELSAHFGHGELRDSEGRQGEINIFGKRARWMDYSGPTAAVPEGREGVAYFDHPENPRHPAHWHVREDGWMGAGICLSGGYSLERGKPLVLRYLLLAHAGKNAPQDFERVARQFAARPGFQVSKSSKPHHQFKVKRKPSALQQTNSSKQ